MSYIGKRPSTKTIYYTPQAADPASPREGELQYADGTARDEGLWVYQDAAWQQVSNGGTLSVLNSLTLTPQAADPGTPAVGMLFVSDGTARAAGMWIYTSDGWVQITGIMYQEFEIKNIVEVRVAGTTNVTLASGVENGDTLDGIVLATGNKILLKNQTTATENGVYVVAASGAPTRDTSADTFAELNDYVAYVQEGTANKKTLWYQTAVLTSLSDNQVWAASPAAKSFTVPEGVTHLDTTIVAGGSGGGGGATVPTASSPTVALAGAGGAAGQGCVPVQTRMSVVPGEVLTINLGVPGRKGAGSGNPTTTVQARGNGAAGTAGGNTTIAGSLMTVTVLGGQPGAAATSGTDAIAPTVGPVTSFGNLPAMLSGGGNGGSPKDTTSGTASALPNKGAAGSDNIFASGGAGGNAGNFISGGGLGGGGGGGGGAGLTAGGAGGVGGNGNSIATTGSDAPAVTGKGAGGGGGGGAGSPASSGGVRAGNGAHGGSGYVKLSWD